MNRGTEIWEGITKEYKETLVGHVEAHYFVFTMFLFCFFFFCIHMAKVIKLYYLNKYGFNFVPILPQENFRGKKDKIQHKEMNLYTGKFVLIMHWHFLSIFKMEKIVVLTCLCGCLRSDRIISICSFKKCYIGMNHYYKGSG